MGGFAGLGLGIVGAGVGSLFGAPYVGFLVGSTLGNILFPAGEDTRVEGPRLSDLRVQVSSYGAPVPRDFGAVRHAGNVIWSTDLKQTAHTTSESASGKGRGPEVTSTNYSYSISCAVLISEGPISAIRRIWANGALRADFSGDASLAAAVASGENFGSVVMGEHIAAAAGAAQVRIYLGSETQEPDPLIVALEGDSPAYRGYAYLLFEELQLAPYHNGLPNFEFEIVKAGTVAGSYDNLDTPGQFGLAANGSINADGLLTAYWITGSSAGSPTSSTLALLDPFTLQTLRVINTGKIPQGSAPVMNPAGDVAFLTVFQQMWVMVGGSAAPVSVGDLACRPSVDAEGNIWVGIHATSGTYGVFKIAPGTATLTLVFATGAEVYDVVQGFDGYVYISYSNTVRKIRMSNGQAVATFSSATPKLSIQIAGDGSVWFLTNSLGGVDQELWRISPDFSAQTKIYDENGTHAFATQARLGRDWATGDILYADGGGFVRYDEAGVLLEQFADSDGQWSVATNPAFPERIYTFTGAGLVSPRNNVHSYRRTAVTAAATTLDGVVTAICAEVGLAPADLDVTALAGDVVRGYTIGNRMAARDALLPLMQVYSVDAVESNGKLKFVRRGGAAAATVAMADMGAHVEGGEAPDPYSSTRAQDDELPREVSVSYPNIDTDYQVSTQYDRRLVGNSDNDVSVQYTVVMSVDEAQACASRLLYDAWTARTAYSMPLSTKYARLEPTDVVNIVGDNDTYPARVIKKSHGQGMVQLSLLSYESTVYTQVGSGAEGGGSTDLTTIGPTNLQLLDTPLLLRDQDDTYGMYAGAGGYSGLAWPGCKLFRSADGGVTYTDIGEAIENASAIGTTLTVLGDFFAGNTFDEGNTVDVTLMSGTLSSTSEANVLSGAANLFLIGSELVSAKNAVLTTTNTYRLSGLLRGRLGTEWAQNRHALAERVVLLDESTVIAVDTASSEVGQARLYKGVTFGGLITQSAALAFTLACNRLKPLSVRELFAARNAANDLVGKFVRRARKAITWSDNIDVPLDESSEAYELDVFAGTAQNITGITQAADGVITIAAHGRSVGDVIYLAGVVGMTQMNERAFTVATVPTVNTFTVGETTLNYTAYTSGGTIRLKGRTLAVSSPTFTYTAAQQTTDFGSTQATIHVAAYQMSSRVGRGFGAFGTF